MAHSDHLRHLFDKDGNLYAVFIGAEFWGKYKHKLEPMLNRLMEEMDPVIQVEPLHEWKEFKTYWDFKYPYCSDVVCGNCGAQTPNWLDDPQKPFRLRSAQLGGLAVFYCNNCGATIRKKHFKDHICFEYSVNVSACR